MLKIWRLEKNVHIIAKTYHNFLIREIRTHANECRLQFIDGQLSISRSIKRVELFRPHFSGFINFRHFFWEGRRNLDSGQKSMLFLSLAVNEVTI